MALIHLPHIYSVLREVAARQGISLEENPVVRFLDRNGNRRFRRLRAQLLLGIYASHGTSSGGNPGYAAHRAKWFALGELAGAVAAKAAR
jgi:hypothetical protein